MQKYGVGLELIIFLKRLNMDDVIWLQLHEELGGQSNYLIIQLNESHFVQLVECPQQVLITELDGRGVFILRLENGLDDVAYLQLRVFLFATPNGVNGGKQDFLNLGEGVNNGLFIEGLEPPLGLDQKFFEEVCSLGQRNRRVFYLRQLLWVYQNKHLLEEIFDY